MTSVMCGLLKLCLILPWVLISDANNVTDSSSARKLSYNYNPGCDNEEYKIVCNETQPNLIHITAISSEDTLHYLWGTTKLPTVIIARTSHDAELSVNWTKLKTFESDAINFSVAPFYSMGLVITEIWEFTDNDDRVDMNLDPHRKPLNLSTFHWKDVNTTVKITENLITTFPKSSNNESAFSSSGSFAIKFSVMAERAVAEDYPHLVFTGNSTQIQLVLDDIVTESKKSRFAIELVAFSSNAAEQKDWYTIFSKSISDEVSPGVFRFLQLKTPCAPGHDYCEGVLSWKPVSYIGKKATVANSSDAAISDLNETLSTFFVENSIATSFFPLQPNVSQVLWYMTFGTTGDGFYSKTKYTSWTLMVGVGDAALQGLSKSAVLAISIGLGLPLILMLFATGYLTVTQCFPKKDDELLLSQDSMN